MTMVVTNALPVMRQAAAFRLIFAALTVTSPAASTVSAPSDLMAMLPLPVPTPTETPGKALSATPLPSK